MKYHDIPAFGITIISVHDTQYDYPFESIETGVIPKKHVVVKLDGGAYDGERKCIILAQKRDDAVVFIHCNATVPEGGETFALNHVGESVEFIWSSKFLTWFIPATGCNILNDEEFNKWLQNPASPDV